MKSRVGTPADFPKKIGVDQSTGHRYLKGVRTPNAITLASIKTAYAINADWLLTGSGDMHGKTPVCAEPERVYRPHLDAKTLSAIIEELGGYLIRASKIMTPKQKAEYIARLYQKHAALARDLQTDVRAIVDSPETW